MSILNTELFSYLRSCKDFAFVNNLSCLSGLTGSAWWGTILGSSIPWLKGNGVVDVAFTDSLSKADYDANTHPYPSLTSDPADWARGDVLYEAMQ